MPPRPPLAVTQSVLLAVLIASSSIGVAVATHGPGGSQGDSEPRSRTSTCTVGTASTTSSGSQNASISTWTAPGNLHDDLQTADDVWNAIDAGVLTPDEAGANFYEKNTVANDDVLVHRIQLNGSANDLLDRLDAQKQGSPTENFRSLVQRDNGIEFRYIGPTACPPELVLNASIENGAFRVVPDHETNSLYLVLDADRLMFELGGVGPTADKWNWGYHAVSLTLQESSGLVAENTTISDHYDIDRRRVEFETEDDELVRFDAEPNQTVAGMASMAPGTVLQIELVPLNDPNATAVHTANVTVDTDGEFDATFDLSDAPNDTLYTVRIPDTPRDDPPHRLVSVGTASGASLGATDHESIGTVLYANGVTTTHGGFLVARNDTTTVAISEYFDPGAASPQPHYDPLLWQNETLTLTVYRDSDDDQTFDPSVDEPYRRSGDPVQTTVNVTVDLSERETTTRTTIHPTTTTTPNTATPTTDGSTGTETDPGTTASTPGFGVVTAFVALSSLVVLARRR